MQNLSAKLLRAEKLTNDVFHYDFDFGGQEVPFEAGHFFILKVEDGKEPMCNRSYSLASSPSTKDHFSLCVKLIPGGRASEVFRALKPDDSLNFMASFGHFTLKEEEKDLIMVATGTGVAPYMGMLPELFAKDYQKSIKLYFGVRYMEDLFYMDQLNQWSEEHENFEIIYTLSKPPENWTGATGRVTDHLQKLEMDPENTHVYICGGGGMVKDVKRIAEEKGLSKEAITFELFTAA